MITTNYNPAKKKQEGFALLILVVVIMLVITTFYFSSISIVEIKVDSLQQTRSALKQAKQALINYAVVRQYDAGKAGRLGKLPCPDYSGNGNEGTQDGNCGNAYANAIGLLPWTTLGISALKDDNGNCLIYAVSPAYKTGPVAALNPDSYGQMKIVNEAGNVILGLVPEDRPVAVIFAPGKVLPGQNRAFDASTLCGADYGNLSAYLDNDGTTDNAAIDAGVDNIIDQFVQMYPGSDTSASPLNDRIITITQRELWLALDGIITDASFTDKMRKLTEALALCVAGYGDNNRGHMPMPAALDLNGGEYRKTFDYDDSGDFTKGFAGRLPYDVTQANGKLSNSNDDYIFFNSYCNNIDLITTADIEAINFKGDSGSDACEYFDLWENWKDHFFYALSKNYRPVSPAGMNVSPAEPCTAMTPDCVRVGSPYYAAIVFFAGTKQAGQQRYSPPHDDALALDGVDDKDEVLNYLENNNAANFPDDNGNKRYNPVDTATSNDIMFCIKEDMSVVECL